MNSTRKLYVPTAFDAFDAIGAATFVAAAIRLDRRAAFGRAAAARRRRGRAGVSGGALASSAHRRDPADGASSVSHTAAAARFSRGGRSGVFGARGAFVVARTSSRRDASSHRRLEPAAEQGRARKHRAQRQWSQRRRPRLSTTPQSGQVKRGGAMVFGLYLFQSFVSVAQQNACWRAVQGCGPIPVVTPGAVVAPAIPNWCQEPDNVVCVAVMKRWHFYKRGGRAVLRSPL